MEKRTIEEIQQDINKIREEIEEVEQEIYDLESDLKDKKEEQEDLESEYEKLENELYSQYPIMNFVDESREDISGQFTRDGKWRVCNGYVLLESNNKFDYLKETKGINTTFEELMKDRERIDISIDEICEESQQNPSENAVKVFKKRPTYKLRDYTFNKIFTDDIVKIIGRDEIETVSIYVNKHFSGKSANLHIKSKDMQAIILGIRDLEE